MITLRKSGNSVTFTFDENSGYLQNGTIDVPINSLALIIDESDMATFKKSASNDIFVSARYEEFGMSKAELEAWYKANMVGSTGGGVDSGTVQTMIDESISGKAESVSAVSSAEYVSSSTTINFKNVDGDVISSIDASDFVIDGMIDDVRIETISGVSYLVIDFNTASGKEDIQIPLTDIFDPSNYYTKQEVDASLSGKADTTAVTASINAAVSGKVDTSVYTAYTAATDERIAEDEEVTAAGLNSLNETFTAYTASTDAVLSGKADTTAVTQSIAEATSGKADTTAVTASINAAVSGKQDTLSAGTNITISGNVISAEGGGKAIEAGRGISVTTGTTADTVSLGFPIWSGGSFNSNVKVCSDNNDISSGSYSFASGTHTKVRNRGEFASGSYNTSNYSNSTFGNSGNTLFSVGNGTADNARHNAFEIRQNGDIYLNDGTNDVKLQDTITATAANTTALGGLSLVKLTQAEYDALVQGGTVDANTLYIITNVVS